MTAIGDPSPAGRLDLPALEQRIRLVDMVAYAGATWDWHRLHHDPAYAVSQGLRAPVVDGQHLGALLANHLVAAFGPRTSIRTMEFRFRAPVYAGDSVRLTGRVMTDSRVGSAERRVEVSQALTVVDGPRAIEDARSVVVVPGRG